jgi:hypothetical protein
MMQVILNHTRTGMGPFRGLLLEPYVHKLLNESGAIGRMRDLETGHELGPVRLGPWKTKNMYESQSQIDQRRGVYNVPVGKNESAIDSIVPGDGYCFQIATAGEQHGISRAGFDKLIKSKAFDGFIHGAKSNSK